MKNHPYPWGSIDEPCEKVHGIVSFSIMTCDSFNLLIFYAYSNDRVPKFGDSSVLLSVTNRMA